MSFSAEKKLTVHFETLGCRLNQDETEGAAHSFLQNGFISDLEPVTAKSKVDENVVLAVINTCTVTGKAEQKARRLIRLMLEKYPCAPVIVTGCYAQLDAEQIVSICPERIAVLPGTQKYILSAISDKMHSDGIMSASGLKDFIRTNDKKLHFVESPVSGSVKPLILNPFSLYTPVFEKHSRASLKIQDGCSCECSFCRIHLARGKPVSLNVEEVIRRVQELESAGSKEIVLSGVNLSQYSGECADGTHCSLSRLLSRLLEETGNVSFRISSLYPQSISDELCSVLSSPRIQPFFHLSIQSGSEKILSLMKRPHSVEHVVQSIKKLRAVKENPFISCDMIAGFPGETEEDFEMTRRLCLDQKFAWIHAFPFSPRPDTPARLMRPQIPERVKGERVKCLTDIAVQGKMDYIRYWTGRTLTAVVENSRALRRLSGQNLMQDIVHCVTSNFLHVECQSVQGAVPGSLVNVKIGDVMEESISSGGEIECQGTIERIVR